MMERRVTLISNGKTGECRIEGETHILIKGIIRPFLLFAKEYFKGRDDLVVAEIGVAGGLNSEAIYNTLNPKLLFLVDNWDSHRGTFCHDSINLMETWVRMHGRRNVIFIKGWSEDVAKMLNMEFDMIYIDGDHRSQAVEVDSNSWLPKIKKGGIIAGHDYMHPDGVRIAVDKIFGDRAKKAGPPHEEWWVLV